MRVTDYQFHDIASFRIVENGPRLGGISRHIETEYQNFLSTGVKTADIVVHFGKFTPKNSGCYILDGKYYVKENYLYCQDYHKYARWEMEVSGLEEEHQEVRISSNILGNPIIPELLISPLIWFTLNRKGFPVIHASCVSKNGKAYLFSGLGGAGKTTICLSLIEKGFSFMSDHFVILSNGFVLGFPSALHMFDFNLLPAVREGMKGKGRISLNLKNLLYRITRLRMVTKINPLETFPHSWVDKAKLAGVFLLIPGSELIMRRISKEHLFHCLIAEQKLECFPFTKYLLEYSYLFPQSKTAHCWNRYAETLEKTLPDTHHLFELEVPPKYDTITLNDILNMVR